MSATIIEGEYGLGYRQSPYLYNNVGFKAIIAEGNASREFFTYPYITESPNYNHKQPSKEEQLWQKLK